MEEEDRIMAGPTQAIQALLRSRLATGRIILVVLVITWAVPITSGGQAVGHGGTVGESGSTAVTWCEDTNRGFSRAAIAT
jgi:hypothetical protein